MSKIKLSFVVYGDFFDPDELSHILSLEPDLAYRNGDIFYSQYGSQQLTRKECCWEISIGPLESMDVAEPFSFLKAKLAEKPSQIASYLNTNNLHSKLVILLIVENSEVPALYFDREDIDFLHSLRSELDCDIYVH